MKRLSVLLLFSLLILSLAPRPAHTQEPPTRPPITLDNANQVTEVDRLTGLPGTTIKMAFNPVDGALAILNSDAQLQFWRLDTTQASGELLSTLNVGPGPVYDMVFSPDGTRLATAHKDKLARVWDLSTGEQVLALSGHNYLREYPENTGHVFSVAWSPDGTRIATGGWDTTTRLWDATTGEQLFVMTGHNGFVHSLAFTPDGTRLVSGSADGTARVWNAEVGQGIGILRGHSYEVRQVAVSPDGILLASGGDDGTIRLWDTRTMLNTGEPVHILEGHRNVKALSFSPDGTLLVSVGDDLRMHLWNTATGEMFDAPIPRSGQSDCVVFSPDSRLILSGFPSQVRMWSVPIESDLAVTTEPLLIPDVPVTNVTIDAIRPLGILRGHYAVPESLDFSPDGTQLVSAGAMDESVRLWDVATGQQVYLIWDHQNYVADVAFSPDGTRFASIGTDWAIRVWDVLTGGELLHLETAKGWTSPMNIAYNLDGTHLIAGGQNTQVDVWDANTGNSLPPLVGHQRAVSAVDYSPDSRLIASGGPYQPTHLWNVDTGQTLVVIDYESFKLAFSPDGALLATVKLWSKQIVIWDVATGKLRFTLTGHVDDVEDIAFSQDGTLLASASLDKSVRFWDITTGKETHAIRVDNPVLSVAFSPDGMRIALASSNDIALWGIIARPDDPPIAATFHPASTVTPFPLPTYGPSSTPTVTPFPPTHTPQPDDVLSQTPAYPTDLPPTFTPTPAPPATLTVSGQATVFVIQGDTLNVRAGAGVGYDILEKLADDTVVTLLEGPLEADGYTWWRVLAPSGIQGWVVQSADGIQTLIPSS